MAEALKMTAVGARPPVGFRDPPVDKKPSNYNTLSKSLRACRAKLGQTVPVRETFHGQPVWDAVVHAFDLEGHPQATPAYAWSSPTDGRERRRVSAVLQLGATKSPLDAVRPANVAEHRSERQ